MVELIRTVFSRIWAILVVIGTTVSTVWPFICTALESLVRLIPEDQTGRYTSSETTFASKEHISKLKANIIEMKLIVSDGFYEATDDKLQNCYNGIGPEIWSSRLRSKTTGLLDWIEESGLVHDFGTVTVPKTYSNFTALNLNLIRNAAIEAKKIGSRKTFWCGVALAVICQLTGYSNFKKGIRVI